MRVVDCETTRAYLAGIVDGECYVGVKRRMPGINKMKSPKYEVAVGISMTDAEPVQMMAAFCGMLDLVYTRHPVGYKTSYCFDLENHRAIKFLQKVFPYLRTKRRQATLAIEFWKLRAESRKHRTKVMGTLTKKSRHGIGTPYRVLGLSDEYIARCDAIYVALLKGRLKGRASLACRRN